MTILKLSELLIKLMKEKGVSPTTEIHGSLDCDAASLLCEHRVHCSRIEITGTKDQCSVFMRTEKKVEEL